MEFDRVLAKRRMVRRFLPEEIPAEVLDRVLRAGLRAPSAGFAQGTHLVVLRAPKERDLFWRTTDPRGRKRRTPDEPPVIAIVCADRRAYLERYSQPDKASHGLDEVERWPVPYWHVDAGMSAMSILLKAVDEDLGAWFFGIFVGEEELKSALDIPGEMELVGAIALGYPHPDDSPSGSATTVHRRADEDAIHRDRW